MFWRWYETLENSGEIKMIMKFLDNFSELWKSKKDVNTLNVFWNKVFVHYKLKLLDFLSDFVLGCQLNI